MFKRLIKALVRPLTPIELNQVIFFVTSKCNLRCQNCFYWRNLNKKTDLSFEEIKKVSDHLPNFGVLLVSGGEPFLREDLAEIVSLFRRKNKISFVGIPTNGTFTEKIVTQSRKILENNPQLSMNIYFSIDGLAKFHDQSRDRKGTLKKALASIKKINQLKEGYPNLTVSINTVISAKNLKEIPKLISFVASQEKNFIDGHYFELVRGDPRDASVKNISPKELKQLYEKHIFPHQKRIYQARKGNGRFLPLLARLAVINLLFQYMTQYRNYALGQPWPMPCLAGKGAIVIDADGSLRLCELTKPVTNLKKERYRVKKYLASRRAQREIAKIAKEKCFCTHGCFITESMYKSPRVVFIDLPLLFLKNLKNFSLE